MGLLKFLKDKFSHKKVDEKIQQENNVEKTSVEEKIEQNVNQVSIDKEVEINEDTIVIKEEPKIKLNVENINDVSNDKDINNQEKETNQETVIDKKEQERSQKDEFNVQEENKEEDKQQDTNLDIKEDSISTDIKEDHTSIYIDKPATKQVKQEKINKYIEDEANTRAYVKGLKKSNKGFMSKLRSLASIFKKIDDEYFDELEQILIEADVGVELSINLVEKTKAFVKKNNINDTNVINEVLIDEMFESYQKNGQDYQKDINFTNEGPTVLLVVGVNGVGKTTTIAKLANRYKNQGKKVLLVAGDTFRAGAVEQLQAWANRINVDIVVGKENSDPSSLCYDGLLKAKKENYDLVIVDTAGRLQNKTYLMDELGKMKRVMAKILPYAPNETFLIIDANTGQNGVDQATVFKEVTPLTGIVITKMDGTSKGGIILAIREKLGIPVRFMGLGEALDDLKEFDLDAYLYGLLIGDENNDQE